MAFESNWAKLAVEQALELTDLAARDTNDIMKQSFDLGFGPAAMIGSLVGATVAKSRTEANLKQQYGNSVQRAINENNKKLQDIGETYYEQVENVIKDLKVTFSPITVIYVLHGTVVDTISVSEMRSDMESAFRSKDQEYFRNYFINKMKLDAHMAENHFAQKFMETKAQIIGELFNKEAAAFSVDPFSITASAVEFKELLCKTAADASMDKVVSLILQKFAAEENVRGEISLAGAKKLHALDYDLGHTKLAFLGFGHKDDITVRDLHSNMGVSFLPDRVLYLHNNMVISQTAVSDMDEQEYDKFDSRDDEFFRKTFLDSLTKNATLVSKAAMEKTTTTSVPLISSEESDYVSSPLISESSMATTEEESTSTNDYKQKRMALEAVDSALDAARQANVLQYVNRFATDGVPKIAAIGDMQALMKEAFNDEDLHPKVLYLLMMHLFNDEWMDWDVGFLCTEIENTFNTELCDINKNKVGFIRVLMTSRAPFIGYHTLEKLIRTFSGKQIDFTERESNLSLGEIVIAMRTMADVLGDHDGAMFNNFNEHVLGYIVEVLYAQNYRVCSQTNTSAVEDSFWTLINIELLDMWNDYMVIGVEDQDQVQRLHKMNRLISKLSNEIALERAEDLDVNAIRSSIHARCTNVGMATEFIEDAILQNVISAIGVNLMWENAQTTCKEQTQKYL